MSITLTSTWACCSVSLATFPALSNWSPMYSTTWEGHISFSASWLKYWISSSRLIPFEMKYSSPSCIHWLEMNVSLNSEYNSSRATTEYWSRWSPSHRTTYCGWSGYLSPNRPPLHMRMSLTPWSSSSVHRRIACTPGAPYTGSHALLTLSYRCHDPSNL